MQQFADITKTFIITGNYKRAEKCLRIAEQLFNTGNGLIKNTIASVYIHSLSRVLENKTEQAKRALALLPISLRKEYEVQVCSPGV